MHDPPAGALADGGMGVPGPAPDASEQWWINVAHASSAVAQFMLGITIAVFTLQQVSIYKPGWLPPYLMVPAAIGGGGNGAQAAAGSNGNTVAGGKPGRTSKGGR